MYYEHICTVSSYCLISLLEEMCDTCVDFGDVLKVLTLCVLAMSWARQLVVALSVQRPNFNPRMLYGEFLVNRVTVRQVFLCQYHSTIAVYLYSFTCHPYSTIFMDYSTSKQNIFCLFLFLTHVCHLYYTTGRVDHKLQTTWCPNLSKWSLKCMLSDRYKAVSVCIKRFLVDSSSTL